MPVAGQTGAVFVPSESQGIANLEAMVFGPDGQLYLMGGLLNGVWRFNGSTGEPLPGPNQRGAVFVPSKSAGLSGSRVNVAIPVSTTQVAPEVVTETAFGSAAVGGVS